MESLASRTTSGFPLSISTALAFESLFPPRQKVYDETREIPQQIVLGNYNELWINVDTLFRNMHQSASKEAVLNATYGEAAITLSEEMDVIKSLLKVEGYGRTNPVFYSCDYKEALAKRSKAIDLREETGRQQLLVDTLRKDTMRYLKSQRDDISDFHGDIKILKMPCAALMLTHIPYDLLSKKLFTKLDLLESNTGKLKTSLKWNTKYYPIPGKDMTIFPWFKFLLMTLGDKVLIKPQSIKLRQQIYECAEKRNWTPVTTMDKCMLDLSLDLHPYDYATIRSF